MEQNTAIDKAFDVLFHLHDRVEPQRISEIGRALDLPRSSVHRLLAALRRRELVEQDDAGRYRPGAGLLGLALGVLEREPLALCARPVLEQAAAALGETFFLVAARAGRLIVLEKAEGSGLLRAAPRVGSTVPVHASAVGKLYLAHAPDAVVLDAPLPRFTPRTIVSLRRLTREVSAARVAGYAESHGEWQDGLSVTAAPVLRRGGSDPSTGATSGTAPALRGGATSGTAPALRGGATSGTAPALRGGATSGTAPALRGGATSGTAPALRGGATSGTAPALRGGATSGTAPALRGGATSGTAPALRGGASMRLLGAVCLAMPSARRPALERRAVIASVVQAAAAVAERLGGEGA